MTKVISIYPPKDQAPIKRILTEEEKAFVCLLSDLIISKVFNHDKISNTVPQVQQR